MSNLSNEQVAQLTDLINARLAEFGPRMFDDLSPGVVRVAHDVIEAYWGMDLPDAGDWPKPQPVIQGCDSHWAPRGFPASDDGPIHFSDDLSLAAAPSGFPPPPKNVEKLTRANVPELQHTRANDEKLTSVNGNGHHAAAEQAEAVLIKLPRSLEEVDAEVDDQATQADNHARFEACWPAVMRELQNMAMGGYMPTMPAWDAARPVTLPKAHALLKRLDMNWTDIAAEAGLKLTPRQAKIATSMAEGSTDEPK